MKKLVTLVAAAAAATVLAVVPAEATFKGANGLLAYQAKVGDHFSCSPSARTAPRLVS